MQTLLLTIVFLFVLDFIFHFKTTELALEIALLLQNIDKIQLLHVLTNALISRQHLLII